jgi:hypothetical protein
MARDVIGARTPHEPPKEPLGRPRARPAGRASSSERSARRGVAGAAPGPSKEMRPINDELDALSRTTASAGLRSEIDELLDRNGAKSAGRPHRRWATSNRCASEQGPSFMRPRGELGLQSSTTGFVVPTSIRPPARRPSDGARLGIVSADLTVSYRTPALGAEKAIAASSTAVIRCVTPTRERTWFTTPPNAVSRARRDLPIQGADRAAGFDAVDGRYSVPALSE